MFSLLVLILSTAGICSFPQNYGQEGNFGYDPFGGTFPHHVPMNLEYVPPIEDPALPQTAKDSYGSYVPMVNGKPIYIPEVYHDGFVFRDMTFPDPDGPPPSWKQDQEANFSPDPSVKVEPVKKIKTHSKRKLRHPPKDIIGARSVIPHEKPAVHKGNDEPVVDSSVVKRPLVHRPTYNYEAIRKFLEEEHDFSDYIDDHGRPVDIIAPDNIKKEVTIVVLPKKEKPVTHKKPIKQKTHGYRETPIVDAFSNKEKHGEKPVHEKVKGDEYDKPVVVEVLSKKEKSLKNPEETADYDEDYDTPAVVEVLTKKEHATDKKNKPIHAVVSDGEATKGTVVKIPSKNKKPQTVVHVKPGKTEVPVLEVKYDSDVAKPLIKTEKPGIHENPEDIVDYDEDYDTPVVVEALTKKEHVTDKNKPIHAVVNDGEIIKGSAVKIPPKNEKPQTVHVKPGKTEYPVSEEKYTDGDPDVVKPLVKTEKPEIEEAVDYVEDYDTPVVVEVLKKKDHVVDKNKPIHVIVKEEEIVKGTSVKIPSKNEKPQKVVHAKPVKTKNPVSEVKYDYDTPDVKYPVKTKKPHLHKKGSHKHPDLVHLEDKDDVEVDYEPVEEHEEDGLHLDNVHIADKDDVEVDYEPVDEWTDEDKDYELGESNQRDLDYVGDENLGKDVEEFDGSGSVSERIDKPEGRSFLPIDPNVWSLMSNLHAQERQKFKSCLTPKNESGNCMPIQMCAVPNFASNIDELLNNVCVIDEVFIGICCPEFPVDTVKVQWDQFVEENKSDFSEETVKECGKLPEVVNKTIAWPWMAPLVAASTGKVFCGGALINEQYVLSAAHCTTKIPHNRILIRLGSLDTDQASDEDLEVVEIKRHAHYNPRNMANDIALLKLARRVPLGDFRGLICLPEDDDDHVDETAILLGWKGFSEKMDEIETLNVLSKENCQRKMGVIVANSVLCTQPRTEQINCNDDFGAPLVIGKDKQFKVIGVLTWNRNDCDSRLPSIFTRVSGYRKWIARHAV